MAFIAGSSGAAWGRGTPSARAAALSSNMGVKRDRAVQAPWQSAQPRQQAVRIRDTTPGTPVKHSARVVWGLFTRADGRKLRITTATATPGLDRATRAAWGLREKVDGHPLRIRDTTPATIGLDRAGHVPWGLFTKADIPLLHAPFGIAIVRNNEVRLPWGLSQRVDFVGGHIAYVVIADPPGTVYPTPPVFIPGLRAYYMQNSISAVSLRSGAFVHLDSVSLSLDLDSWVWSLQAQLSDRASLMEVAPDANGPAQMDVTINGYTWRLLVESYSDARQFGSGRWSLNGRGTQALLAAPYRLARSYEETQIRSAAQLADQEVLNTGAEITWSTVDWTVPAGVWSYQDSTPMDALVQLAAASGAVILPDRTSADLTIRPRYLISPWDWAAATPAAILPPQLIGELSLAYKPSPAHNGVWVSGRNQGVQVLVKRTGTDGGAAAPMVVDPLILTVPVATERGRNILARAGNKAEVSLTVPLLPLPSAPGLLLPGALIEVQDPAGAWRGMVAGVGIAARGVGVAQTVTVERHY